MTIEKEKRKEKKPQYDAHPPTPNSILGQSHQTTGFRVQEHPACKI